MRILLNLGVIFVIGQSRFVQYSILNMFTSRINSQTCFELILRTNLLNKLVCYFCIRNFLNYRFESLLLKIIFMFAKFILNINFYLPL